MDDMVIQKTPEAPSTNVGEVMELNYVRGWMMPIIQYLTQNKLPREEAEATNKIILSGMKNKLDEIRETTHKRGFADKQRIARGFNIEVRQKGSQKGDLMLKEVADPKKKGKFAPNWKGPFSIFQK